jgi:hypothetical protein
MTFSHNEGPEPLATVGALETGSAGKLESLLNATTPRPNQDAAHAHVSRALAEAQAEKIRAYWRRRGVVVDVWTEQFHLTDRFEWRVRSTLRLCPAEPRR